MLRCVAQPGSALPSGGKGRLLIGELKINIINTLGFNHFCKFLWYNNRTTFNTWFWCLLDTATLALTDSL